MTNNLSGVPAKVLAGLEKVKTTVVLYDPPTYDSNLQRSVEDPSPLTIPNASPPYDFAREYAGAGLQTNAQNTIQEGDVGIILPPGIAKEPKNGGRLEINGIAYPIVSVEPFRIDAVNVAAYELQLRQ